MPIYKTKEKNKEGLFKYRVRVNYTDDYGKHKQLTRTAWGNTEAKRLERKLIQELINKQATSVTMTVAQLYDDFKKNKGPDIRQTTWRSYENNFGNHILPKIGDCKLNNLNVQVLTGWKTWVNEKELSLVTKRGIYGDLRTVLNYGVKMEYLPQNPLNKIDNFKDPYYQEKDMEFYTPEEFVQFINAALEFAQQNGFYDYYVFFCLAYYTGARKGEIHALRWNCLDGNMLSIKRSISQKIKGPDVETPPKNKSSIRTVQIPSQLIQILLEHKTRQQSRIKNWKDTGFICGYYQPLRDSTIDTESRKYCAAAGVKHIRVHDFRHSHASLLLNNGINALEVANRLGHSTVTQTLKTYAHLFPNESEKSIKVLESINNNV